MHLIKIAILILPLISGCNNGLFSLGSKDEEKVPLPNISYDTHIKTIVNNRCIACHAEGKVGPFPLENYQQVAEFALPALSAIERGSMPPWSAKKDCREYKGDYSLSEEEKVLFRQWVDGGKKESGGDGTYQPKEIVDTSLSRVDLTLSNSQPYQPKPAPDDTRCFVIDWPYEDAKYVTGMDVVPSNLALAHHASVYLGKPANAQFYKDKDLQNDGAGNGYPCSATMGVGKSSAIWIGGWLPGLTGFDFFFDSGILVEPKSTVILQVHYHKALLPDGKAFPPEDLAKDLTEIKIKIDDTVKRPGTLVTFTNPDWMVELEMKIPAGESSVTHNFSEKMTLIPNLIGQQFPLQGEIFDIMSINAHGHSLMKATKMSIIRADGSEECLIDAPNFDPDWQLNYIFEEPARVYPGDKIFLECQWNNSASAQAFVNGKRMDPIDVNWGDGAREEMCFGLMFVGEATTQ